MYDLRGSMTNVYMSKSHGSFRMRVLWYNWRDIKHPDAGGAEVFTHEIMRRLVNRGYQITLFTAHFPHANSEDNIDGVKIVREGGKYTVYNRARGYYEKNKSKFDLVVDESNTRPFLTPKFIKGKPLLALYHQLSRDGWFYETPFPLNFIGYHYLELKWLSYYKDVPIVTVSRSTREDLERYGMKKIFMVPEGLSVTPLSEVKPKGASPILVFMGRLKNHKLPDHAIRAFALIKNQIPDAHMWVIGDGYLRGRLEKMACKDVIFYGRVSNELKYDLLSKAHLMLMPGVREGWGLVVTETNAMGTPAVAYDIAGVRDSVVDGETGVLTRVNTPEDLARNALDLLRRPEFLKKLSVNALSFSRKFSWDATADRFEEVIGKVIALPPYCGHAD